jgi:hypothetical protein
MPLHEPAPIHIRIDTQEQRSGIPALLAAMPQVHIEVVPMHMGDYDIGGDPCRVFERKTGSDFLCSLAQGRLFAQLAELRKSRLRPSYCWRGTRCASVTPRCGLKASAGRSATSPLSCACRSYPAGDRRILRSWSILQQNNARMGTRLTALREGDARLLCPSGRCRSCCHFQASGPSPRMLYARAFAACTTCWVPMPLSFRRSPVSRQHEPLRWNSCCTPSCPRLRLVSRESMSRLTSSPLPTNAKR